MKHESGNWQVTRNCCVCGLCFECRQHRQRPIRMIQGGGYSQRYAEYVASNWRRYGATAEPMAHAGE